MANIDEYKLGEKSPVTIERENTQNLALLLNDLDYQYEMVKHEVVTSRSELAGLILIVQRLNLKWRELQRESGKKRTEYNKQVKASKAAAKNSWAIKYGGGAF